MEKTDKKEESPRIDDFLSVQPMAIPGSTIFYVAFVYSGPLFELNGKAMLWQES